MFTEVLHPLDRLLPLPRHFKHRSEIHGQRHVGRVMVHAWRLLIATGLSRSRYATALWAAVYLHDLAREHDGACYVHGNRAVSLWFRSDDLYRHVRASGLDEAMDPEVASAVQYHSLPYEMDRSHQHYTLTALLKDADGLDRVRLGDLDPSYLRFPQSVSMVPFAQALYEHTERLSEGPEFAASLMRIAMSLSEKYEPASSKG